MRHFQPKELLSAYFDGEVTAEERAEAERLLREDSAAADWLEYCSELRSIVQSLPRHSLNEDLSESVLSRAEKALLTATVSGTNGQPPAARADQPPAARADPPPAARADLVPLSHETHPAGVPAAMKMRRESFPARRWNAPIGLATAASILFLAGIICFTPPPAHRRLSRHDQTLAPSREEPTNRVSSVTSIPADPRAGAENGRWHVEGERLELDRDGELFRRLGADRTYGAAPANEGPPHLSKGGEPAPPGGGGISNLERESESMDKSGALQGAPALGGFGGGGGKAPSVAYDRFTMQAGDGRINPLSSPGHVVVVCDMGEPPTQAFALFEDWLRKRGLAGEQFMDEADYANQKAQWGKSAAPLQYKKDDAPLSANTRLYVVNVAAPKVDETLREISNLPHAGVTFSHLNVSEALVKEHLGASPDERSEKSPGNAGNPQAGGKASGGKQTPATGQGASFRPDRASAPAAGKAGPASQVDSRALQLSTVQSEEQAANVSLFFVLRAEAPRPAEAAASKAAK